MKILDLPLKRTWYEMIESGIKTEEYREVKPYWCKRLVSCRICVCHWGETSCMFPDSVPDVKKYTHVRFRYGYTSRTMLREIESISIGYGKPEWGAPTDKQVFIIKFKKGD